MFSAHQFCTVLCNNFCLVACPPHFLLDIMFLHVLHHKLQSNGLLRSHLLLVHLGKPGILQNLCCLRSLLRILVKKSPDKVFGWVMNSLPLKLMESQALLRNWIYSFLIDLANSSRVYPLKGYSALSLVYCMLTGSTS